MTTQKCNHVHTHETAARCYQHPVALAPYTDENPMAHGNITVTERCVCGAERDVCRNQGHVENGPWYRRTA